MYGIEISHGKFTWLTMGSRRIGSDDSHCESESNIAIACWSLGSHSDDEGKNGHTTAEAVQHIILNALYNIERQKQ